MADTADIEHLVNWIMDDPSLLEVVVRLCKRRVLRANTETLGKYPWNVLETYGLATFDLPSPIERWRVLPTDVADEVYRVHLIEEQLKESD